MNNNILNTESNNKLKLINKDIFVKEDIIEIPLFKKLITDFTIASQKDLNMKSIKSNINNIQTKCIEFNNRINKIKNSKLESDILEMNYAHSLILTVNNQKIKIHFLSYDNIPHYKSIIIHAINTFCYTFPFDYNGLEIVVCLDENLRTLKKDNGRGSIKDLQKESKSFCASGVTNSINKYIVLTKKEEIIKLLFHELCHYAHLDYVLLDHPLTNNWSINKELNTSEAYTEFMSIILNSIYQTLHLKTNFNKTLIDILNYEITYSLYLTTNILRFFKYNKSNYQTFFNNTGHNCDSPIATWEYIFLRTGLLVNLQKVLNSLDNFTLNNNKIIPLMNFDTDLLNKYFDIKSIDNVSYTIIEIDWLKI